MLQRLARARLRTPRVRERVPYVFYSSTWPR